jgi:hypothetical protein
VERVNKTPRVAAALDAFLEGAHVMQRHPSLAAVAFTASVETIATGMYKLQTCPDCGRISGLRSAFKAALRLVVDGEKAAFLDSVYSARSKTVHAGRLHGGRQCPALC